MYGCHFIVLVMIGWHFGIVFDELGAWTERNSASLAQASLSRLSENCRTSFLVWFTLLAQATWFSVERHLVSLRREWLA